MRRGVVPVVLLATVVLLSGCSTDEPPPNDVEKLGATQVLATSLSAAEAQTSMRVVTQGSRDGLPFLVDMRLRRGGGATGTVTLGAQRISVLSDGTSVYVRAPEAYWRTVMAPELAKAVGTMWVAAPLSDTSLSTFAALTDYDRLVASFLDDGGAASRGDVSRILDREAVQVVSRQGSVWVSVEGPPLPVQADSPETGDVARFGEWGAPVELSFPSRADTIDLSELGAH
mgnify:CR=1 FL=1